VSTYDFDVFGMAKTNLDWRMVKEEDRLYLRTKEWWESTHLSFSHNRTSPPLNVKQWGGTALFSLDQAAHRVVEKGSDNSQLGRWCWTKYMGKNNHLLRIYSAYCPNPPVGPGSVFSQHRSTLLLRGDSRNPRVAFEVDLCKELSEVLSAGEHVILMLDGNADMRDSFLSTAFQSVHLKELILHRHGNQGPSTFRRNNSNTPIDGIWASAGISILKGGYLDYDQVLMGADHICLWLDIHFQVAFGSKLPPMSSPKTRRLHCRDPRVVKNYLRVYEKAALASNLLYRVETLAAKVTYPFPPLLQQEYEELDALRCQFTEEAERKCHKLCKGQVAFSPDLQSASRVIKVFTLPLRKKQCRKVSSRLIARSL
jgi:hypothetical protein